MRTSEMELISHIPNSETRRGRVKNGESQTILTSPEMAVVEKQYRIRMLTEKECFRLQGVRDEDYDKITKRQKKTSKYHLAGDSICTACLMAIFGEAFQVDYRSKIEGLVDDLTKETREYED